MFFINPRVFEELENRLVNLQEQRFECSRGACVIARSEPGGGRSVTIVRPLERATDQLGVPGSVEGPADLEGSGGRLP